MSDNQTTAGQETTNTTLPENARKVKFFFKTIDIKDDDNNVIAKDFKHPDVEGILPVPTENEIVVALQSRNADGTRTKQSQMVLDHMHALIEAAAKGQIQGWREENPPKSVFAWTNFDMSKLTLEGISNLPKGQRGAWSPSDEELKSFNEAYADVMINTVAYDANKVKVHCAHFLKGMAKMKTDKAALGKMLELLAAFAANASEEVMEEQADTYNWLREKTVKFQTYTPKNFAEGL